MPGAIGNKLNQIPNGSVRQIRASLLDLTVYSLDKMLIFVVSEVD